MRKLFLLGAGLSITLVTLAASPGRQPTHELGHNVLLRKVYFQPCSYWYYDFNVQSYTCRSLGVSFTVYEASDVDRLLGALEQRLAQLDDRVKKLEQGP